MLGAIIGVFGIVVAIGLPLEIERRKRPSFAFDIAEPTILGDVKYLHVKIINRPLTGRWLFAIPPRDVSRASTTRRPQSAMVNIVLGLSLLAGRQRRSRGLQLTCMA